ncbi:UNVERIFIED_CONTAM: hypothetical protein HDU68_004399 [Siphonaria sp. JEL0065]|nr:hypothetical protein HDU68_004399 [Siphonaria sp. JEL0065]
MCIDTCDGYYHAGYQAWILEMKGDGVSSNEKIEKVAWTIKCSDEQTLRMWLHAVYKVLLEIQEPRITLKSVLESLTRRKEFVVVSPEMKMTLSERRSLRKMEEEKKRIEEGGRVQELKRSNSSPAVYMNRSESLNLPESRTYGSVLYARDADQPDDGVDEGDELEIEEDSRCEETSPNAMRMLRGYSNGNILRLPSKKSWINWLTGQKA